MITFLSRITVALVVCLCLVTSVSGAGVGILPTRTGDTSAILAADSVPESVRRDSAAIAEMDSLLRIINLDEVVVTAPVKPILMRGDTTIINTDAFKTRDGAFLEDLIRLIPGMAYDKRTGSLTYNGKPLNDIMINGQPMFKDGKVIALENLRADLLSNIKIYDRATDEEMFLGLKGRGKNYVLDLQTRSRFDGLLVNSASVKYGTEGKKNLELSSYSFGSDKNFTLMLGSGNANMMTDYKDNRSDHATLNVSRKIGKVDLNLSGHYGYSKSGNESSSTSDSYLPSGNTYNASQSRSLNRSRNVSSDVRLLWHPDDKTMFSMSGALGMGRSRGSSTSRSETFDSDPCLNVRNPFAGHAYEMIDPATRVNGNSNDGLSNSHNLRYDLDVAMTRKFNKRGTALSLSMKVNDNDSHDNSFNRSTTEYFRLIGSDGRDSILYRDQYNASPSVNRDYGTRLSFLQPVGKSFKFELSYEYTLNRSDYSRETYDLSPFFDRDSERNPGELPPDYETAFVDSLSNRTLSRTHSNNIGLRLDYNSKNLNVSGGCFFAPESRTLDQKTGRAQADTLRRSVNFNPTLSIRYNNSKWNVGFGYSGSTVQPQLSSLLSLIDNSHPLNVTVGNPDLKASYRQSFNLDIRHEPSGLQCNGYFSNAYNEQTTATYYNPETGGRTMKPVNVSGSYNGNVELRYTKFTGKFLASALVSGRFERNVGLVNEDMANEPERSVTRTNSCSVNLSCSYFPQRFDIHFNGSWEFRRMDNDLHGRNDIERSLSFSLDPALRLPCGLSIIASSRYYVRTGTMLNRKDNEEILLNTGIELRFLKGRSGQLSLEWKDMLNKQRDYYYHATYSGIYKTYSRKIGSYVLLTFTYRFNKEL